ncbi:MULTISPECIES: hypothetical protein [unclassified Streptomyces]|uniref:hypothetical protein n=1 Tax=unclassified Streptomyces TaxID=2593676 RepID=UPI00081DB66F|nr:MULTISPECIES: hypothetical protein [unclassified Streptomyces]MYR92314.1 hypothetical protein [Streptomyces sp. SID4937]SCD31361.1 hypothetical protein GA0115243_100838 [Streptomyces sp. ScaeMP-e83]
MTYGLLTPEVPLGPFEASVIKVWSTPGKTAKLHATEHCSRVRTGRVVPSDLPLPAVMKRMCPQCARYGSWGRPGTGVGLFLGALTGLGLLYELDRYSEADEDYVTDNEVQQAAAVLLQARHEDPEEADEDEEDDWRARHEAQQVRTSLFDQWRSAAGSLHRAHQLLAPFPWLTSWADAGMRRKASHVAGLQRQASRLVTQEALVAAAGVAAMDTPELPGEDPVLALLGDPATAGRRLESLWRRWSERTADSWQHPREHDHLAYDLVQGISSRRKGRQAALERAQELVSAWTAAIPADTAGAQEEQVLLLQLPSPEPGDRYGRDEPFLGGLSEWELGVLVHWATEADWDRLTVTVRVPQPVAARLLSGRGSQLSCSTPGRQGSPGQTTVLQVSGHSAGPGVFDDTPVAERRPVTASDLQTLRILSRDADGLYLVLSLGNGPEVLSLSVLEKRVAAGGRYVFVAAAGDLPDTLIAPRQEELTAADTADAGPVWAPRVHGPSHPDFGRHLGTAEGERLVVRLARGQRDAEAALRCLALARGTADLRNLDDGHDTDGRRDRMPFLVWDGLLAADRLSLRPFRPAGDNPRQEGSGLPLGVLARVQLYTTDGWGRFEGKAHAPGCQHQGRDRALNRYFELLTVEEMLRSHQFIPCSKCGGYATRRLSAAQVAYYRAAHQMHNLAGQVRWALDHPDLEADTASLLTELRQWDCTPPADEWFTEGNEDVEWQRFVARLLRQLETAVAGGRQRT